MDIAVTGATGLVGTALLPALRAAGHRPVALVRPGSKPVSADVIHWDPQLGTIDLASLAGIEGIVHLAGAGIADKKWTSDRKTEILQSRLDGTKLIATTIAGLDEKPSVFLSGSAIGIYGNRGNDVLTEESAVETDSSDFAADVCRQWEAAAQPAADAGIRTVLLRTGIVQSPAGGALAKQLPLFKLGIGGRIGSGNQYLPWVSIDDEVSAIIYLLTGAIAGPVNITAPHPCTNREFTSALGKAVHRPTFFPTPKFGPQLLLGKEATEHMLYSSANVVPTKLLVAGFTFKHATIAACLADLVGN